MIDLLAPTSGARFIDCTVNGGGHTEVLLQRTSPDGSVLALDADPLAIEIAAARLADFGSRLVLRHRNFRDLQSVAHPAGFTQVDGILMDLGLSSGQLDRPDRGFSFTYDGPLDMRFDPTAGPSAAELIGTASASELEQTLRDFGEEPRARRIAQAIVDTRREAPITTTAQLARIVARAVGRGGRIHPATRTFQALRIAVNDELEALRSVLPQAVALLRRGGRLAVISFHSLEDRIVKNFLSAAAGRVATNRRLPITPAPAEALVRILTRRPITPSAEEQAENPRSRSARLRVAERL